eukprot:GHVU01202772.1.p1 GENE.GHVU01202772.1~~GHVU01202772.1.p1  ORF type:complete len:219 (+),score=22.35 GHVU01202772.1:617-1273(+)
MDVLTATYANLYTKVFGESKTWIPNSSSHFSHCLLSPHCEGELDIDFNKEVFMGPINFPQHWCLLVARIGGRRGNPWIAIVDSLKMDLNGKLKTKAMYEFQRRVGSHRNCGLAKKSTWSHYQVLGPQQNNDSDCGLFVIEGLFCALQTAKFNELELAVCGGVRDSAKQMSRLFDPTKAVNRRAELCTAFRSLTDVSAENRENTLLQHLGKAMGIYVEP